MHPIERLRYVARAYETDASLLAEEAADALGSLDDDPYALVTSVRRLIEAHTDCGALWWVSAHLLASGDPARTARDLILELSSDTTGAQLAAALPGAVEVIASPSPMILEGIDERPDVTARPFGGSAYAQFSYRSSYAMSDAEEVDRAGLAEALAETSLVLVEARVAGVRGYVFAGNDADLVDAAEQASVPIWVVTPVGRILPAALFDACLFQLGLDEAAHPKSTTKQNVDDLYSDIESPGSSHRRVRSVKFRSADIAAAIVGPEGPSVPSEHSLKANCPVPGELCRRR